MKPESRKSTFYAVLVLALGAVTLDATACSTCFGQSDDDLARGMNAGIFSLLAVVAVVLSAFATFFVYLAKRSTAVHSPERSADQPASGETHTR